MQSVFVQVRGLVMSQSMSAGSGPGRLMSARSVEVWVELGGQERIARRPSPELPGVCRLRSSEVDPFEETRQERAMTGDWWFGLITGMGLCLILWWVVDRHRRR